MGFRFKRFDYVGGVGTWGSSSTPRTRSEAVLKDMADWLISNDTGWSLDTSRNATTSDFVEVPFWNQVTQVSYPSTYNAPSLFFVNSISGCKLFMCVQGNVEGSGVFCPETLWSDRYASTYSLYAESGQQGESAFGIIMCIIPGGSSNDFGSTFDKTSNFIPSDGTPILGTCEGWGYTTTSHPMSYIYSNTTGYCFSYTLFSTPYVLGINGGFTTNGSNADTTEQKGYFIGRIIGTTAHDSLQLCDRYGIIQFGTCSYGTHTEFSNACTTNRSLGSSTIAIAQTVPFTAALARDRSNSAGCLFLQDGDRLLYTYNAASVRWYPESIDTMSVLTQSSAISNAIRWVPYSIGVSSTDLATYGVIAGDGFKGYLDTDLFRCSLCTPNQLYNNGSFIGCANNLMIGWDPANTDSL